MVVADPPIAVPIRRGFCGDVPAAGRPGGVLEDPLVQTVDPENSLALERLFQDLTWKGPDALVLAASPDSPLALQLADAQAKGLWASHPRPCLGLDAAVIASRICRCVPGNSSS